MPYTAYCKNNTVESMPYTLSQMSELLPHLQRELLFFKKYLRSLPSTTVDTWIHTLYDEVSKQTDCLQCANCCKQLEPGVDETEIEQLAEKAGKAPEIFYRTHVAYDGSSLFLKSKPCIFLNECTCTVYTQRPAACAAYPHLDGTQMKYKRSLWDNYSICPIVFSVVEALKQKTGFIHV